MSILKRILSLISIICLIIAVVSKSTIAAVILLVAASIRIGILIGEWGKRSEK